MKCKRAHLVYDRDFIVVDDISGVWKMRSECKIDGYGFLSANGDPKHPQETPPIIIENMAAWPDPRPRGIPQFTPEPNYVYFIGNYEVISVDAGVGTLFNGANSIGLNGIIVLIAWYLEGIYVGTGFEMDIPMDGGPYDITMHFTDQYGNQGDYTFTYDQPYAGILLESGGNILLENGGYIAVE